MSITRFMLKVIGLFVIALLVGVSVTRTIGLTLRPDESTRVIYLAASGILIGPTSGNLPRRSLWSATLDGENPRLLVSAAQNPFDYGVHPNGAMMSYSIFPQNALVDDLLMTLYLSDLERGKRVWLARCIICSRIRWSPDGAKLAFLRQDIPGASGSLDVRDLTTRRRIRYSAPEAHNLTDFQWESNDSMLIVLQRHNVGGTTVERLDLETGGVETTDQPYLFYWSPDHQHHALTHFTETRETGISIYNRADEETARFVDIDRAYGIYIWETDSVHLTAQRSNPLSLNNMYFDVIRVSLEGALPETLIADERYNDEPVAWSADGRYLLFSRRAPNRPLNTLWLYDEQDGSIRPLLTNPPPAVNSATFAPPGS